MKAAGKGARRTSRSGPQARIDLARRLVASVRQDMCYLGWFAAICRTYTGPFSGWPEATATARRVRHTLDRAEDLARSAMTPTAQTQYLSPLVFERLSKTLPRHCRAA